ncbi:MAG: hypothetical protein ED859_05125 [Desulfuromonadales bacterium]|nr:MAG: hypothetical protein ED859_05125 [Desulfuromonadales bacterium]
MSVCFLSFFPEGQASAIHVSTPSRGRTTLLRTIQKARKPPTIKSSFMVSPPVKQYHIFRKMNRCFIAPPHCHLSPPVLPG